MKKYDLIVLGAGSGGLSVAAGACNLGLKVLMIEKNKLGGDCLWNGCIPSKTLIHEAEKLMIAKQENFSYDPDTHFREAIKRIKMVQVEIAKTDSVERFTNLGVDVKIGEGKFYSKNKIVVGKEYFKFKKCVVATGSRPKIPENFKSIEFLTNEDFFHLEKLSEDSSISLQ